MTLAHTDIAAPAYFIIGGVKPEDAAVITKGRLKVDDIWRIDTHSNRYNHSIFMEYFFNLSVRI